jgi:argininosuccinate lyase
LLAAAYAVNDQSPLGSAAGYGVPLPIDRQYVADLLGFDHVQNNVIYAQNARGKIEAAIIQALMQIMLDLSKLAQDILLFTTAEYGFFQVSQEVCTGSSIMPQKRNVDVMELLRARAQTMLGYQQQIFGLITGLPSGFNMDYMDTKRPLMEAIDLVKECMDIATLTVSGLSVNKERLLAACTFELFAADDAYEMVMQEGIPFRDAYKIVGREVLAKLDSQEALPVESEEQLVQRLKARNHLGGAGNLGLELAEQRLAQVTHNWQERASQFQSALEKLIGLTTTSLTKEE